jgi:hypothetical protein
MSSESATIAQDDTLAPLARAIYDEMNVEPRQMHVAIELAKWYLSSIREALVKRDLRIPPEGEALRSTDGPPGLSA